MNVGYDEWHDGVGYDLDALDDLSEEGKTVVESWLVPRADRDWRDLEALDRLGTTTAFEAILRVRRTAGPLIALEAHGYGPEPSAEQWETAIVAALTVADVTNGLVLAQRCALAHPSPAVVAELWRHVRVGGSPIAYHAAETIAQIAGVVVDEFNHPHRSLLLRLQGPNSPERQAAVQEFESLMGQS